MARRAVLAGMATTALACSSSVRAAAIYDGFENFVNGTGQTASGSTVTGYGGTPGNGNWTANGSGDTAAVVDVADGTAFQGQNYLRLTDPDTGVGSATKTFASEAVPADGASISFALRDGTGLNSDQVVLRNASQPVLQTGIKAGGTFSYTPYTGATAGSGSLTTGFTAVAGDWYLFQITYSAPSTVGTYSLTITDESNPSLTKSFTNLGGQSTLASNTFTSLTVQSSGTGTGNADLDAISIAAVPEPTTLAGVTLLAGSLLRRRRR